MPPRYGRGRIKDTVPVRLHHFRTPAEVTVLPAWMRPLRYRPRFRAGQSHLDGLPQPELNHDQIPNHGRDGRASSATSSRSIATNRPATLSGPAVWIFCFNRTFGVENPTAGE